MKLGSSAAASQNGVHGHLCWTLCIRTSLLPWKKIKHIYAQDVPLSSQFKKDVRTRPLDPILVKDIQGHLSTFIWSMENLDAFQK